MSSEYSRSIGGSIFSNESSGRSSSIINAEKQKEFDKRKVSSASSNSSLGDNALHTLLKSPGLNMEKLKNTFFDNPSYAELITSENSKGVTPFEMVIGNYFQTKLLISYCDKAKLREILPKLKQAESNNDTLDILDETIEMLDGPKSNTKTQPLHDDTPNINSLQYHPRPMRRHSWQGYITPTMDKDAQIFK